MINRRSKRGGSRTSLVRRPEHRLVWRMEQIVVSPPVGACTRIGGDSHDRERLPQPVGRCHGGSEQDNSHVRGGVVRFG